MFPFQIEEDRDSVQQLYDRACLESNDASDELRRLANRNKDLNTQIDELTNQLMSEEKHRQIAEVEHLKIFVCHFCIFRHLFNYRNHLVNWRNG